MHMTQVETQVCLSCRVNQSDKRSCPVEGLMATLVDCCSELGTQCALVTSLFNIKQEWDYIPSNLSEIQCSIVFCEPNSAVR